MGRATSEQVDDLRDRVRRTRRVITPHRDDPARGLPGTLLDELLERWSTSDPRSLELRAGALPWQSVGDGREELRLVHQRAADPHAPVAVLLHGWPDSVLRFERVLPLLSDLHVVVPALPGYPFSAPDPAGMSANEMAGVIARALTVLGYDRYVVSAGDIGAHVAEILAAEHPDRVAALHLTNIAPTHALHADPARMGPDALAYLQSSDAWFRTEGGYLAMQRTRPNTLAAGLADSPAGLMAWIVEKLIDWADTEDGIDSVWQHDDLVDWVAAYWFTGTIATSFSSYAELPRIPARIETPTVVSVFPRDIRPAPRSYVEAFVDLREYIEHERGGHFAAWERPDEYAADLRRAVGLGASRDR